jgi:hypothetical protein
LDEQDNEVYFTAYRSREYAPDRKYVGKPDGAGQRVPESQPEFVVRQDSGANWRRDDPELQGWFFKKDGGLARTALRLQPVSPFEDSIDRKGIDRFVGFEIEATKAKEEGKAKEDEDQSQPRPADA